MAGLYPDYTKFRIVFADRKYFVASFRGYFQANSKIHYRKTGVHKPTIGLLSNSIALKLNKRTRPITIIINNEFHRFAFISVYTHFKHVKVVYW